MEGNNNVVEEFGRSYAQETRADDWDPTLCCYYHLSYQNSKYTLEYDSITEDKLSLVRLILFEVD
jgi:hypothetical protein